MTSFATQEDYLNFMNRYGKDPMLGGPPSKGPKYGMGGPGHSFVPEWHKVALSPHSVLSPKAGKGSSGQGGLAGSPTSLPGVPAHQKATSVSHDIPILSVNFYKPQDIYDPPSAEELVKQWDEQNERIGNIAQDVNDWLNLEA